MFFHKCTIKNVLSDFFVSENTCLHYFPLNKEVKVAAKEKNEQ